MSSDTTVWDTIIVGAGLSGLAARRALVDAGLRCLTLEKSRGLGGRSNTRRVGDIRADLGAQFTSARGNYWRELLESAPDDAVTPILLHPDSSHPRYVHAQGMSRLAALLAADPFHPQAPIKKETRVTRVSGAADSPHWEIVDQNDQRHKGRSLILTAPLPQALELMRQSEISIGEAQRQRLEEIQYSRCLAGAFIIDQATDLPAPGILKNPSPELSGIFEQKKKGLIASAPTLVVQAAAQLSLELWDAPSETILAELWKSAQITMEKYRLPKTFETAWLQKWRYCEPLKCLDTAFETVLTARAAPLLLAGDAFGGSKIEGAVDSGRAAGLSLAQSLALPPTARGNGHSP